MTMRSGQMCALLLLMSTSLAVYASKEKPLEPPAPDVMARVRSAHSIYLSNATLGPHTAYSSDGGIRNYFGAPYKEMYQALAAWPGVQLVDTPSRADLIFQVFGSETDRFVQENSATVAYKVRGETFRDVSSSLKIIDPKTQTILWEASVAVGASTLQTFVDGDFAKGAAKLLAPLGSQTALPKSSKSLVMLPSQLRNATKVFLRATAVSAVPPSMNVSEIVGPAFTKAKLYQIVGSIDEADLILAVTAYFAEPKSGSSDPPSVEFSALDPKTGTIIWQQRNDLVATDGNDEQPLTKTMPYAISDWKSLISEKHL